ncbi:uncharacterized protein E5676_scaffold16547G00010 [Cucumis melo var. makuwa]|uniref:DUF8039 domain-containing protein n=1 Tax=Cucumis melo var. makuwa TaxID=1194695 RepID=A0A5D3DFH4_CUCMM|nr:uncharacterized protein E5676_scaffold16547G00010 [Cucumis melo var. makuwa]
MEISELVLEDAVGQLGFARFRHLCSPTIIVYPSSNLNLLLVVKTFLSSNQERIEQTEAETTVSTSNVVDDALSKVLGPDRGHVRGFGFGVTRSKLSLLSHQDHKYKGINNNSQTKCKLLDWYGWGEIVAEGRWSSNDPTAMVHHIPIGPHAIRVWIDVAKKPNAYLWRPTSEMTCIEEALGSTVAWPSDKVNEMESSSPED